MCYIGVTFLLCLIGAFFLMSNLSNLYILLVEPSRSQRKIIALQFEELGIFSFTEAENGSEALDIIETDAPDLVISAMHLPDMTGRDLVLEMRATQGTESVPFMLISTETSFEELDPIKQAGATAILPKPFKANDLRKALMTTIEWNNPDQVNVSEELLESMKILVVDDSALARKMIVRTLKKMGMKNFQEAADGAEAIPLIQENHFDMIVTDYNMPKLDGHQLLKFIRMQSNQPDVPVLMITTEGDEGKLAAIQQEGVSAIVDKPFDVNTVRLLIEAVFNLA